mgnify:FL=1
MTLKTTLPPEELDALIEGPLLKKVKTMLRKKGQVETIFMVMKKKAVTIIDATVAVNKIYRTINPNFDKKHRR